MQSKRKPYFAGSTVSLKGEGGGILYNRYTAPEDVLLEPNGSSPPAPAEKKKEKKRKAEKEAAPAAPAAAEPAEPAEAPAGGDAPAPKERKKPRWTDDKKAAAKSEREAARAAAGGAVAEPTAKASKKEEKKKKDKEATLVVRKLAPEERISGPSNAEEATKIRQTLGFVAAPDAAAAPAPAGGFAFGFAGGAGGGAAAAPAPAPSPSDGTDSSSSDAGSDSEEERAPAPAAAQKATTSSSDDDSGVSKDPSSSSSSSDSDSDSDDSSSGSDSDAPAPAPAQRQAPAPASPVQATTGTTAAVSPLDSEYVPRRIYAGGMPYGFTEGQVREYWEYCGPIEALDLLTFPDTGRFRGIAFVTFATEEAYAAALACDGEACEGQTLKVQRCKWSAKDRRAAAAAAEAAGGVPAAAPAPAPAAYAAFPPPAAPAAAAVPAPAAGISRAPAPKTSGYDVAYVGNIAYEADEAAVRALFEPYGVTKVRIHTEKDTGRPKGYAHVHFGDEAGLDGAMALDGTPLMGRPIRVGYAQPKKAAPGQG